MKKYLAEMVGTMVLVLMGCGVAVSLGCDPVYWWHLWLPHQSSHYPGLLHCWTYQCQRLWHVYVIPVHWCLHRFPATLYPDR